MNHNRFQEPASPSRTPHVSIVVCTYNRAAFLRDALDSLSRLTTSGAFTYDVVVVDNGSTDETPEVIGAALEQFTVPARAVREPKPGVAAARNRGLIEATGPWIAFFDDDQTADPRWLAELIRAAQNHGVRLAGGGVRLLLPPGTPSLPLALRRTLGETWGSTPCRFRRKVSPGTGNLLLHRSVIDQVGNFDERLKEAGEDTDLFRRIRAAGFEGWFVPTAIVWHRIPEYRLRPQYLRWSSQRTGWVFAHRDRAERGLPVMLASAAARAAQAALVHAPRWIAARLLRDECRALDARCLLWRAEGYLRGAAHFAAGRFARQAAFHRAIDFRGERASFADAEPMRVQGARPDSTEAYAIAAAGTGSARP